MKPNQVAVDNPIPKSYSDATAVEVSDLAAPVEEDFSRAVWISADERGNAFKDGKEHCSVCGGRRVYKGEGDKQGEEEHEIVRRIVRPNNAYGGVFGGGEVWIEPRHMNGPEWSATMSPREWDAYQERLRKPLLQQPPMLAQMVQRSQQAYKDQLETQNAQGRERMMQQLRAHQRDVLLKSPASADAEVVKE